MDPNRSRPGQISAVIPKPARMEQSFALVNRPHFFSLRCPRRKGYPSKARDGNAKNPQQRLSHLLAQDSASQKCKSNMGVPQNSNSRGYSGLTPCHLPRFHFGPHFSSLACSAPFVLTQHSTQKVKGCCLRPRGITSDIRQIQGWLAPMLETGNLCQNSSKYRLGVQIDVQSCPDRDPLPL